MTHIGFHEISILVPEDGVLVWLFHSSVHVEWADSHDLWVARIDVVKGQELGQVDHTSSVYSSEFFCKFNQLWAFEVDALQDEDTVFLQFLGEEGDLSLEVLDICLLESYDSISNSSQSRFSFLFSLFHKYFSRKYFIIMISRYPLLNTFFYHLIQKI